jgi:anti-sigma factor RsiW
MCDFLGNWIAWLDGELPPEEAERARQHLEGCSECRNRVDTYKQVTLSFDAFCDERMTLSSRLGARSWWPVISAVGAAAAVVALIMVTSRARVRHTELPPQRAVVSVSPAASVKSPLAPAHRVERAHRGPSAAAPAQFRDANARPARDENASALPYEPVIEISILAEEMYPPGAVPPGMGFAADLAIAADGSADQLRLQPRLAGFERGTPNP